VNQSYVIATSTKVDISGVKVEKFDDKYFAREKKTRVKKTEGELFETEKEVQPWTMLCFCYQCLLHCFCSGYETLL
jgi:ribosomal protein L14E/L6E/L27E